MKAWYDLGTQHDVDKKSNVDKKCKVDKKHGVDEKHGFDEKHGVEENSNVFDNYYVAAHQPRQYFAGSPSEMVNSWGGQFGAFVQAFGRILRTSSVACMIPLTHAAEAATSAETIHVAGSSTSTNSPTNTLTSLVGARPLDLNGVLIMSSGGMFIATFKWLMDRDKISKVSGLKWLMGTTAYLSAVAMVREKSTSPIVITFLSMYTWAIVSLGSAEFKKNSLGGYQAIALTFVAFIVDILVTAVLSWHAADAIAFFPPIMSAALLCWVFVAPKFARSADNGTVLPMHSARAPVSGAGS